MEIPFRVVNDRNGKALTTSITYDNSIWQILQVTGPNGNPVSVWGAPTPYSFGGGVTWSTSPGDRGLVTYTGSGSYKCGNSQIPQFSGWQYTDSHGTTHPFPPSLYTENGTGIGVGCPDLPIAQAAAIDGSGYWLEVSGYEGASVYDMHGNLMQGVDTNGNALNLGRSLLLPSGYSSANKTIYISSNFGEKGIAEFGLAATVLSNLTLPDGRKYSFTYDDAGPPSGPNGTFSSAQQGHYGSLTGITLPTGGHITITSEINTILNSLSTLGPFVVEQIDTPDGTWSFNYSTTGITATAPTDPATGLASQTTCCGGGPSGSQTVSVYSGVATGTPLRKVSVQNPSRPTSVVTTLNNGPSSHVDYTYADLCTPRVSTKKEYGFSGSLIRETDATYYTSASDNTNLCKQLNAVPSWTSPYLQGNQHITDIPSSITVYGPSGCCSSPVAQTNFTYDSTPLSTTSGSAGASVLGLPTHDDVNFGKTMKWRGNPTVISQMTGTGKFITTRTNYYNILGELVQSSDGNGNLTKFDFTDSWNDASCLTKPAFAYPTTVTNALGQTTNTTYNSCDGSIASAKDQNDINAGGPGTVYTYDGLQRATKVSFADGGGTTTDYGGATLPEVITTTTLATPEPSIVNATTLDGLGRVVRFAVTSDPCGSANTDTKYDSLGRIYTVSNSYRPSTTCTDTATKNDITTYTYDALNRTILQKQPDASILQWCYNGASPLAVNNCLKSQSSQSNVSWVDYSDESGVHWQRTSDSLGRLTSVMEPDGSNSPTIETDYSYDALNNLTEVDQWGGPRLVTNGVHRRFFKYDSLSRLTNACNPEAINLGSPCSATGPWSASYSYDANSNVITKTDARGTTINYSPTSPIYSPIDALNRVTMKTYSDGSPAAHFIYDAASADFGQGVRVATPQSIGRLSSQYVGNSPRDVAVKSFGYDAMGREVQDTQCWGTECSMTNSLVTTSHQYDLAGNVVVMGNSTPSWYNFNYDGAGRLKSVDYTLHDLAANTFPSWNLANSATYTPGGQLLTLDGSQTWTYDNRMRVQSYKLKWGWVQPDVIKYGYTLTPLANGNIQKQVETTSQGSTTWQYTYDNLNRLYTAVNSALQTGCQENYDNWGNRKSQLPYGGSNYLCTQPLTPSSGANNRIDNYCYDTAGNLLNEGLCSSGAQKYVYDAENRMISSEYGANTYAYGADGQRVTKVSSAGTFHYVRDLDGSVLVDYKDNSWYGQGQYSKFNGQTLARIANYDTAASTDITWSFNDWLGTTRLRLAMDGGIPPRGAYSSLPFGDALTTTAGLDGDPHHFTGKERDTESGLDYFGARYNSSSMGRFMSPDPSMDSVALRNPQTWNRYSYTLNNPLKYLDPTGMCWVAAPSGNGTYDWMNSPNPGQTCVNAAATSNGSTLTMYGSSNAKDITKLNGNEHGMIDLQDISSQHDATIDVKVGDYTYVNAQTGANLFNFLQDYQSNYPDAPNLYLTEAGAWDGSSVPGHQSHKDGMQIDMRYVDDSGKPIQGKEAYNSASADRMWDLMRMSKAAGLTQIYAGDENEWGDFAHRPTSSPHEDHWHISIPNPKPPKK